MNPPGRAVTTGALCCALAVIAGAFGSHGLRESLDARSLELWETAARYLIYSGLGQLAAGLVAGLRDRPAVRRAGDLLLAGGLLFSGTVAALALGGPSWLGAVTPFGGLLLIAGFVTLAWGARRSG